jgi:hypothetical protein
MKKILIFAVALSLMVPAVAFAKAEFSLGGFIKLDAMWDTTQNNKTGPFSTVPRNTDPNNQHGYMRFTAQGSRFNFTMKGPKLFGAQVTGFIEIDFDSDPSSGQVSASSSYVPRLRHAMFRLNWPETELLFGQYWSLFSSWYAEGVQDGPFIVEGTPTARLPQIRLTQKFLGDWSVIGLVGDATARAFGNNFGAGAFNSRTPYSTLGLTTNSGEDAATPQVQGSVKYAHDWWGKAAYYGHPRPFTAQIMAGWQRSVARAQNIAVTSIDGSVAAVATRFNTTYVNPWCVMGTLFIPVIPTHSANLAGTASILAQYWIGQGVNAFGWTGDNTNVYKFNNNVQTNLNPLVDLELVKRWGGLIEGQYYFTNQWYASVAYGQTRTFGVDQSLITVNGVTFQEYGYDNVNGGLKWQQHVDATLWYRPIQAIKFGLQYSYLGAAYWTRLGNNNSAAATTNVTNRGDEHRVEFAGYFFF